MWLLATPNVAQCNIFVLNALSVEEKPGVLRVFAIYCPGWQEGRAGWGTLCMVETPIRTLLDQIMGQSRIYVQKDFDLGEKFRRRIALRSMRIWDLLGLHLIGRTFSTMDTVSLHWQIFKL